jgi:SAM-dependent methyltransferase
MPAALRVAQPVEAAPGAAEPACAVCGGASLALVLSVAKELDDRGLIPTTDAYGTALDDIVECDGCGHRQLAHIPSEVELLKLYVSARADHYVEEAVGQRHTSRAALEQIERHVPVGRLLDLGCWVGFLLAEARERGWEVTGVEPSSFAAAYARDEFGLEVLEQDLLSANLPAGAFDAIVLGDVIEHLTDPLGALEHIAGLLAPGGVLYMTLPDSGSRLARAMGARWWSVIPTHVQYFSRASLSGLLRRAGYEPLAITTAPKTFSVRYYLWRLSGYSQRLAERTTRAAAALGFADRLWTPDFRDRMAVIARAPR